MTHPITEVADPISDLEFLVGLLEVEVGPIERLPNGDIRCYGQARAAASAPLVTALYRLRGHHLVEWGEIHFYAGSTPVRHKGPLPVLTEAGRRLALRELG